MVESQPPVVFAVVSKLRSQVSALDAWHVLVSVLVSDLNDERCHSIVVLATLTLNNASGHN